MERPEWFRLPRGVRWTTATGLGTCAVIVLACFALWACFGLLGSIFTFGSSSDPSESLADALKQHETLAALETKRFTGRSAFFAPSPPVRKNPKPVKPVTPPIPPPPPPPLIPAEYAGPKPIGAMGETVFFADNVQLKIGEEKNGVKVIATTVPWSVKLAHSGGEYDVPLWGKNKEEFFNGDWSTLKASIPGIEVAGATKTALHVKPVTATVSGSSGTPVSVVAPEMPGRKSSLGAPTEPSAPNGSALPTEGAQPATPATPLAPSANQGTGWTSDQMSAPPPLGPEQVSTMTAAEAQASLTAIARARMNRSIDDATKDRLNQEFRTLSDRIKELKSKQSNPG